MLDFSLLYFFHSSAHSRPGLFLASLFRSQCRSFMLQDSADTLWTFSPSITDFVNLVRRPPSLDIGCLQLSVYGVFSVHACLVIRPDILAIPDLFRKITRWIHYHADTHTYTHARICRHTCSSFSFACAPEVTLAFLSVYIYFLSFLSPFFIYLSLSLSLQSLHALEFQVSDSHTSARARTYARRYERFDMSATTRSTILEVPPNWLLQCPYLYF